TAVSAQPAVQQIQTDARSALSPGLRDAGVSALGIELEHSLPMAPGFADPDIGFSPPTSREEGEALGARIQNNPGYSPLGMANTDMALSNNRLFIGNFNGFNAYQLGDGAPRLAMSVV